MARLYRSKWFERYELIVIYCPRLECDDICRKGVNQGVKTTLFSLWYRKTKGKVQRATCERLPPAGLCFFGKKPIILGNICVMSLCGAD